MLFLFFLLGLGLRFNKYFSLSILEADEGRDLLVARHIAQYGFNTFVGHDAAGLGGLKYGPYYYYLLSFFNRLRDDIGFTYLLITFWHSLGIIELFVIGKNFLNERVGLMASALYAVSYLMLLTNNVWGAYLSFQVFLLSLFVFSFYYKTRSKLYLYLHLVFFALAFATEYSTIVVLPIFVVWTYLLNSNKARKEIQKVKLFLKTSLLYASFLAVTFVPQIIALKTGIIGSPPTKNLGFSLNTYFSTLASFPHDFLSVVFVGRYFLLAILTLCAIFYIWASSENLRRLSKTEDLVLLAIPIGSIVGAISTPFYAYHYLALYIFFFLSIALFIDRVSKKHLLVGLIFLAPIALSTTFSLKDYDGNSVGNEVATTEKAADSVVQVFSSIPGPNPEKNVRIVQNSNVNSKLFYPAPE